LLDKKNLNEQLCVKQITLNQIITLKNINLSIKHGEFVCIIGDVGSGKSSLLSALIGDLLYLDDDFL
jgi:ABC-type lipoprotein export system ATPase subunit